MNQLEPEQRREPQPSDVGTRIEHFQDHLDSLKACIEALKGRCYTDAQRQTLIKLTIAAEVMESTIDAFTGMSEPNVEYTLYRLLKSVPSDAASIEGGRGTPLV